MKSFGAGKRRGWALFALVLFACGEKSKPVEVAVVDAGPTRKAVAHLDSASGQVSLEREGKKSKAELSDLYVKDALETGPDSQAEVRFGGDRVVELGPDGRLVISEDATGLVLQVDKGLVLTRVPAKGSDGKTDELGGTVGLSIQTPFGITRVGSASEVKMDIGPDGANVDVLVGTVELVSRNGKSQTAEKGDALSLTAGEVKLVRSGKQITLDPVEVVLTAVSGKAELKKKDGKAFKPLGKKPQPIAVGDTIRTVKNGRAQLASEGAPTVELAGGAEFVFDGSAHGMGMEETNGQLKKGTLKLNLEPRTKSRVNVGGLSLESEQGGQYTIEKTPDGFDVESLAGDATITREGAAEQPLKAGQRLKLGPKVAKVSEAERAELVLPSRQGLTVFHPGLGVVALSWEGAKGDYLVRVTEDAAMKEPVLEGTVHDTFVNVPAPVRGTLFWKVTTLEGKDVDKGSASFAPEPQLKDLARQRNEVPEGTETTTIYFQDKPPAVTFNFNPRGTAAQYRVAVYKAADLSKPLAERTVGTTSAAFEAGALGEGSYRWSVTPLLKDGQEGEGGRMNKLEIIYDNSVPQLIVRAPRNGERAGGKVPTNGVAPVGSKVYINGKPAPLDDKSRFEGTTSPIGRTPIVVFRLTRPSEPDVYTVRMLRRGR